MLTLEALFAQPDNETVLRYLNLRSPRDVGCFEAGTDGSPFDEGGQIFFHRYGRRVPAGSRCTLELCSILAHERTARIFALHQGRFTIALRRGLSSHGGDHPGSLLGGTMDGFVNLSALGPGWMLLGSSDEDEDDDEAFFQAHELAGR